MKSENANDLAKQSDFHKAAISEHESKYSDLLAKFTRGQGVEKELQSRIEAAESSNKKLESQLQAEVNQIQVFTLMNFSFISVGQKSQIKDFCG